LKLFGDAFKPETGSESEKKPEQSQKGSSCQFLDTTPSEPQPFNNPRITRQQSKSLRRKFESSAIASFFSWGAFMQFIQPMLCQTGNVKDLERSGFIGEEKG
jgi:hypothetical protein